MRLTVKPIWGTYVSLLLIWSLVTPLIHGWLPTVIAAGWQFDLLTVAAKGLVWVPLAWWGWHHFPAQLTDAPKHLWQVRLPGLFWLSLISLIGIQALGQLWQPQPFAVSPNLLTKSHGQLINVMVAAGIFEEWFFRGWLTNSLLKTGPFWRVNLAQAVAFQVIHFPLYLVAGYSPLVWLGNIACVFPLGLLFGWNYQRSHSLWPSMLLHIVWNSLVFLFN